MPVCVPVARGSASSAMPTSAVDPSDVRADLLHQRLDDALLLGQQCRQKVEREDLRVIAPLGQLLRPDDGFLSFYGEFVESHVRWFSFSQSVLEKEKKSCTGW